MKLIRSVIEKLYKIGPLKPFKPVLDAMSAALLGSDERSEIGPHIHDSIDLKRYMGMVIGGLLPAALASIYFYGFRAILIILVSYIAGGLVEVAFAMIRKHEIHEGFLVTGMIFPLTLPPTVPLWVVAVGVIFGTLFGKEVFGGTGRNIFNPALVGRLFVTIAFPAIMTTAWLVPGIDGVTAATPLSTFKGTGATTPIVHMLLGRCAGSMGETFRLGIIAGGIFLIFTKVANWRIPVSYLGSVLVCAALGSHFFPGRVGPPAFQLVAGGLLYGAFFMATDPVTSPFTKAGKYVFGLMCGFLTVLIRSFSGYVEGVMFSIVVMNAFVPLIDHVVVSLTFKPVKK